MEWWDIVQNGKDHRTDSGEGQKETYRRHEETAPRPVGDALVDHPAQGRSLSQQQQESRCRDREQ
jgi:hypothetical protein